MTPYDDGGATASSNLAPLCRRHHRTKTHAGWRYAVLTPGTYEWTSPRGDRWLVDRDGTDRLARAPEH
ncbi:HNH endonuclease [Nocardioides panacisoli]|uniref:HNH endonuclease signature motif containing protein n=1 Tax=Nocardioides panacisoli TaxID=627624 RepID=UPI001C628E92|nr:HNH endonuclease signature motif containing protein [Nocardioides panacisoli]QYJ04111.1 HNH endonuclease [Nocardioides panacisoli]